MAVCQGGAEKAAMGQTQRPHPGLGCTRGRLSGRAETPPVVSWCCRLVRSSGRQLFGGYRCWLRLMEKTVSSPANLSSVACCDWTNGWGTGGCSLLSVHYFWWDDNYLGSCSHSAKLFPTSSFENIIVHSVKYCQRGWKLLFLRELFVRVLAKISSS